MIKTKRKTSIFEIVIGCILLVYCLAFAGIFVWSICTSLKTGEEFIKDPSGLANSLNFRNFIDVFDKISYNVKTEAGLFP